MSSNSELCQAHMPMFKHSIPSVNTHTHGWSDEGIVRPAKTGEDLFLRTSTLLDEGESVTHRFDCNTVGLVPLASGYGSRTLTHSAVHVLDSSKDNASALSSLHEKIPTQNGDNDLWELSETQVGDPKRLSWIDSFVGRSDANVCGTQSSHFTGSHFRPEKEGVLQRQMMV